MKRPEPQHWTDRMRRAMEREGVASGRIDQAARILELEAALANLLDLQLRGLPLHTYTGHCPDNLDPKDRDPDCPACRILLAAEATLRGETTDAPE